VIPSGSHRRRRRRRGAVVDDTLTVNGQRVVRRTVLYLDADSGEPPEVAQRDTQLPAVLRIEDDGSASPPVTP